MNSSFMTAHEMICYYLLDRLFFFRLYLLTVLNEKKFAVSDKESQKCNQSKEGP